MPQGVSRRAAGRIAAARAWAPGPPANSALHDPESGGSAGDAERDVNHDWLLRGRDLGRVGEHQQRLAVVGDRRFVDDDAREVGHATAGRT